MSDPTPLSAFAREGLRLLAAIQAATDDNERRMRINQLQAHLMKGQATR